jgi:uncharacterized membrane protein
MLFARLCGQVFEEAAMAFCTKCGAAVSEQAAFCPVCGAPQTVTSTGQLPSPQPVPSAQPQISENAAGALCYVLGWLTGLIFYFIDKRPFVRFHAKQSMVVFGGIHILIYAPEVFFGLSWLRSGYVGFSFGYGLFRLIHLFAFILWILLMIKAYQGHRFRVPVAADLAESIFGKS